MIPINRAKNHTSERTIVPWTVIFFEGVPKCAGMGCDIPDIRLTVCIGECPDKNINELSFVRASQRCLGVITDVGEGWS